MNNKWKLHSLPLHFHFNFQFFFINGGYLHKSEILQSKFPVAYLANIFQESKSWCIFVTKSSLNGVVLIQDLHNYDRMNCKLAHWNKIELVYTIISKQRRILGGEGVHWNMGHIDTVDIHWNQEAVSNTHITEGFYGHAVDK